MTRQPLSRIALPLLLLIPLLATPALAIEVQPTALPYEPIVITHPQGTTVQIIPWGGTVPRFLNERYVKQVTAEATVFSAPPGAYIVFGGGGMGIVIIEGASPQPPPPVPDPDDPSPPPPVSDLPRVVEASRNGAVQLADPETAAELVTALTVAVNQVRGSPLEVQVSAVKTAIEVTLLARNKRPGSATKDWLQLWRVPVNNAVQTHATQADYLRAIEAAVDGLRQAASSPSQRNAARLPAYSGVDIVMVTGDNCVWCDKWKVEVQPTFVSHGGFVKEVPPASPDTGIPQFEVSIAGKGKVNHVGFMSLYELNNYVTTLRQ